MLYNARSGSGLYVLYFYGYGIIDTIFLKIQLNNL